MKKYIARSLSTSLVLLTLQWFTQISLSAPTIDKEHIGINRGIIAILDGSGGDVEFPIQLAKTSELTIYVQSPDSGQVLKYRKAAEAAGMLGTRVFVEWGSLQSIHLGENIADRILITPSAEKLTSESEVLKALRPRATALFGERTLIKPVPEGIDDWSHPYHGPDNNPQSTDQLAQGSFRTQFLGFPKFSPMPEQTVIAGGRIFKAMGHIAHKANQNEMLNTLLCINAYNGTILWSRPSPPGFMIHRNTMIATEDKLYLGDHESCKIIDAESGKIIDQITVPPEISDGPVWKWMAMKDGILYAMVGNPEIEVREQRSARRGLGHWPWGMWEGHDYSDPRTAFGFGRTILAIDMTTPEKKILWHYRDIEFLDARAICMKNDRIFCFSPERFLLSIDALDGTVRWRNTDETLLKAINVNAKAQHYITGYATTTYMKCNDDFLFFAGPQRDKLVVASTEDGKLAWTHPTGNLQLVLRDDAVWAAGPQNSERGVRLEYATGNILSEFPARRACTRATGGVDSIFYRANGGTVRVLTESNTAQHFDPMRPPCQDGVLIANGQLYWGPWMCGCQLSLYGNISLSPVASSSDPSGTPDKEAYIVADDIHRIEKLDIHANDWPSYRGNNSRNDRTAVPIPDQIKLQWDVEISSDQLPTAPVTAGGLVFIADRSGIVRALDDKGNLVWKNFTGGAVYFPPAVANNRVYAGSADGRVYCWEAGTGRFLWSRRLAEENRWIPVYDRLVNAWPVAGGVVVDKNTVYAAAGITHYDGTHVVALDGVTGEIKARNDDSGTLDSEVNNGISLQGNLSIIDGELRFNAGGVYETARYNLESLACLNTSKTQVNSQFRTAFYPYYPAYGKYVSLDYTCDNGCLLAHDASYEGSKFVNLSLEEALPDGVDRPRKEAARWILRRGGKAPKTLWKDKQNRRFTSFIVGPNRLVGAGHPDADLGNAFLTAIDINDGSDVWNHSIPAHTVKGGTAIDSQGRIFAALENGRLLCFVPSK